MSIVNSPEISLTRFTPTDTAITKLKEEFMPLTINGIDDTEGFKAVHSARLIVKKHRCDVEKVRKDLKAEALEYGRKVDGEAKRITALLEPIENHLAQQENAIDAERERIKNAARLKAEQEEHARREAEAAKIKAEQDAENERLRIERTHIAAEQAKLDEDRRQIDTERKRLADIENARQAEIAKEQQRLTAIEAAKQREIENERIRKETAERTRIETEQRIAREAADAEQRRQNAEAARLRAEALRPDGEKLLAVAQAVEQLARELPDVSDAANDAKGKVIFILGNTAAYIMQIAAKLTKGTL